MKWTSHSDYQAMKPYIAIAEKTKANAMKLFEQEMEKLNRGFTFLKVIFENNFAFPKVFCIFVPKKN